MRGFSFRSLTFFLLVALLVWTSSMEVCNARRGRHWRQNRITSATLAKKKGKTHSSSSQHHQKGVSKPKAPSPTHKPFPPPTAPPTSKALPPPPPGPTPREETAPTPTPPQSGFGSQQSAVFNVMEFGAKGDGTADDTKVMMPNSHKCTTECSMPFWRNPHQL